MSESQLAILGHTIRRAPQGVYCGDSIDMQELVRLGYMVSAGNVAWCPDEYFRITTAGKQAWQAWKASQPQPPRISRRKARAKQRYSNWLDSGAADCGISFGKWLGISKVRT